MTEHVCLTGIDGAWGCTSRCPYTHRASYDAMTERLTSRVVIVRRGSPSPAVVKYEAVAKHRADRP